MDLKVEKYINCGAGLFVPEKNMDAFLERHDKIVREAIAQDLKEKCGSCGTELILKVFWSKEGHQQKIECPKCGMAVWRNPIKREEW